MPKAKSPKSTGSALGFEAQLWAGADKMRHMDASANVFWLPPESRWHTIIAKAKSPEIGKVIDDAMGAIECENPTLKGVLPRDYARSSFDKVRLGGLVDIISNIGFDESAAKSKDVLGRVGDIAVYGQESNYTTWKLARMNLAPFAVLTPISARATPTVFALICIPTSRPISFSPTRRST